ncbi:MAG: 7-carboxy-7-deazaguanine synthase QueE [Magnetococcales bacterium]|nr:7-carboxy-7-deazaguanine synthase QueE [Magnetococcales bacterium]
MTTFPVCDLFHSLQGEGSRAGMPMTFLRFWGCPLRCPWCDEPRHRDPATRQDLSLERLDEKINRLAGGNPHLLLTGGEPLAVAGLQGLVDHFRGRGYSLAMETSGEGGPFPDGLDWITLSPKTVLPEDHFRRADEVKFVLGPGENKEEEGFILEWSRLHHLVLVQPRSQGGKMVASARERCLKLVLASEGRLRLSLQIHKWLGLP